MLRGDVLRKVWLGVIVSTFGFGAAALAADATPASKEKSEEKPYPLTVCVVTDEKLGGMGEPHVIQYQGREVKYCCDHCEKDFRKDAQKYLAKIDKAAKGAATQPSTQPAAPKDTHEHQH